MGKIKEILNNFRLRKRILAVADAFIVVVAGLIVNYPLPLFANRIGRPDLFVVFLTTSICCFGSHLFFGAYNRMWRYFSTKDYFSCIYGVVTGIVIANVFVYVIKGDCAWEFAILHATVATVGICMFRYIFKRAFVSLVATGAKAAENKRTMIIGAGNAAKMLLDEIANNKVDAREGHVSTDAYKIEPVCLIDDDRQKLGTTLNGVVVAGSTSDIPKIAALERIEQIIFSIPSCPPKDRQVILDICGKTGLPVKVLPFIGSLLESPSEDGSTHFMSQIRDIKVEDLLGRESVKFNNEDIRKFIEGKVCMVTGGGGSIGSELVRQIARYNPKQIIIVDSSVVNL